MAAPRKPATDKERLQIVGRILRDWQLLDGSQEQDYAFGKILSMRDAAKPADDAALPD